MQFDMKLPMWTQIKSETHESILKHIFMQYKAISRPAPGQKIFRYASNDVDLIFTSNYTHDPDCYMMNDVSNLLDELDDAVKSKVGEYPVLIAYNSKIHLAVNIVVKNPDEIRNNSEEWQKFITDVIGTDKVKAVVMVKEWDWFKWKTLQDVEYKDIARLYVPTHDGVPVLWINDTSTPATNRLNLDQALSTEAIKQWFNGSVKNQKQELEVSRIRTGDLGVQFVFNKGYQHFNGSIPYSVLLYPVFLSLWEDILRYTPVGGQNVQGNYDRWRSWNDSDGMVDVTFAAIKGGTVQDSDNSDKNDELGVWEKIAEGEYKEDVCEPQMDSTIDSIASLLVKKSITMYDNHVKIMLANKERTHFETWQFTPADGVKIIGRSFEIAEFLTTLIDWWSDDCIICKF